MFILWQCFAVRTEVGVMAYGTFIPVTHNIRFLALAEWAITNDSRVLVVASGFDGDRLIDRQKTMTWMGCTGSLDASRAIVKIGAIQAFVADSRNVLFQLVNHYFETG